jgi:hypothetical protein
MKYTRLTKEQFEVNAEFSTFWQLKQLIKQNGIPSKRRNRLPNRIRRFLI